MKKIISITLVLVLALCLIACNGTNESNGGEATVTESIIKVLNPLEYTIYMNIFASGQTDGYIDREYTKEGILAIIHDSFNQKDRYYVWGYSDETMCCDWQWEFTVEDASKLPPIGSYVKVTGNFGANEKSLDGFWLEDGSVEAVATYKKAIGTYDMTTMSPTLTRVQIINMYNFPADYNGKDVKVYGRALMDGIQHPYYDGSWSMLVESAEPLPSIGTYITVTGKFFGTSIEDCKIVADTIVPD
jgi:hypothetical protein